MLTALLWAFSLELLNFRLLIVRVLNRNRNVGTKIAGTNVYRCRFVVFLSVLVYPEVLYSEIHSFFVSFASLRGGRELGNSYEELILTCRYRAQSQKKEQTKKQKKNKLEIL